MANPNRKIDKTHLSIDNAEQRGFLHRDYIAHCLRWTHVAKFLNDRKRYATARILDIGCGKEIPMAKLMHSSRMQPHVYYACDVNKLTMPKQFDNAKWKPTLAGNTDVCDLTPDNFEEGVPNIISCFEVLEHVAPEHSRRMLNKIYELLEEEGTAFISTPCWDPDVGAAANHINEMTYTALGAMIEDVGFAIEGHWGTFASIKDYKDELGEHAETFEQLRTYYDTNYLATIFAPLFPHRSRNCIWQLKKLRSNETWSRLFPSLRDVDTRWSSSEDWRQLQP